MLFPLLFQLCDLRVLSIIRKCIMQCLLILSCFLVFSNKLFNLFITDKELENTGDNLGDNLIGESLLENKLTPIIIDNDLKSIFQT